MKIEPIDKRLLRAMSHVSGFADHMNEEIESLSDGISMEDTFADYKYFNGLKESVELVKEYTSCFGADGSVAQRGQIPDAWNPDTIFESESDYKMPTEEEASPEQKDANAKKLLEEIT